MDTEKNARPQVLLIGNGVIRSEKGKGWCALLDSLSTGEPPEKKKANDLSIPMPLRAIYVTNDNLGESLKNKKTVLFGKLEDPKIRQRLIRLLSMNFDEILTTNYSYELEMAALNKEEISQYTLKKYSKNIITGAKVEPKYLLRSCNAVPYDGTVKRIWHIHGEARKPNSMILGHYYYSGLLKRIIEYLEEHGKNYRVQQAYGPPRVRSWLDSFILGDVYILGLGLDFSEFDLWWLLNRKKRENASHGKIHYFVPSKERDAETDKWELLKILGVDVEEISDKGDSSAAKDDSTEQKPSEKDIEWENYYTNAIDSIAAMVEKGVR